MRSTVRLDIRWRVSRDRTLTTLHVGEATVAVIRKQHAGWVVEILLPGLAEGTPLLAVPSRARGRHWLGRWLSVKADEIAAHLKISPPVTEGQSPPQRNAHASAGLLHGLGATHDLRGNIQPDPAFGSVRLT